LHLQWWLLTGGELHTSLPSLKNRTSNTANADEAFPHLALNLQ
jgi:hypothetical protein